MKMPLALIVLGVVLVVYRAASFGNGSYLLAGFAALGGTALIIIGLLWLAVLLFAGLA